ncbi:MAG: hypothetical protein ACFFE8_13910 [Candidatus Heimdallarchaeota archaeon]
MPEVKIPGLSYAARLTNRNGHNILELLFRGDSITSHELPPDKLNEPTILSALKAGCTEADIIHQIPEAMLVRVAQDLFKESGLDEGKPLVPTEFEVDDDSKELDKKLNIIITTLQEIEKRLEQIEIIIQSSPKAGQ